MNNTLNRVNNESECNFFHCKFSKWIYMQPRKRTCETITKNYYGIQVTSMASLGTTSYRLTLSSSKNPKGIGYQFLGEMKNFLRRNIRIFSILRVIVHEIRKQQKILCILSTYAFFYRASKFFHITAFCNKSACLWELYEINIPRKIFSI